MKITRTGLAVLLIAGMAQAAEEFEIKAYSPSKGTVEIRSGSEYTNRLFSSFSAAEQRQITGWLADKELQSSSSLSIETEKKEVRCLIAGPRVTPQKKSRDGYFVGQTAEVSYTITLENRSEAALENIEVAYQIFYEQCENTIAKDTKKEKVRRTGTEQITLAPGSTRTLETVTVSIRDGKIAYPTFTFYDSEQHHAPININDRLAGLYLCVSKEDVNGKRIGRECMVGDVPEKEDWAAYQQREQDPPTRIPEWKASEWALMPENYTTDAYVKKLMREVEKGSYLDAFKLCQHYCGRGDQEKTKQWADKARELFAKRPADDPQKPNFLTSLDKLEKTAEKNAKKLEALDQATKASGKR